VNSVDQVYERLRERILFGGFAAGDHLRQEALATELGVSRTPLREAIRRLEADGLVEVLSNRGARIIGVRPQDLHDALEARLVLEPRAAGLAAERASGEAIDELRGAVAEQRHGAGSGTASFAANQRFHLALVRAAGNSFLLRFAQVLWVGRTGSAYDFQNDLRQRFLRYADEHERIVDAIAARDPALAQRLTHEHIRGSLETVRRGVGTD
jgi:DNA-binding GntR family transcriptional regulator